MIKVFIRWLLPLVLLVMSVESKAQTYCASGATSPADSKIDSVIFAGIVAGSPASTCETYTDNTSLQATVTTGLTYPMRLVAGSCGGAFTRIFKVFIDWNNNGSFAELEDSIATSRQTTSGACVT